MRVFHLVGSDLPSLGIQYLVFHDGSLSYDDCFHTHLSRILRPDSQVGKMRLGNGHQRHIAKNAIRCPVVIVVEVAAGEL